MEQNNLKVAVLNYANGNYLNAQKRLQESIQFFHPSWTCLFFQDLSDQIPSQNESPMAFKPYLFEKYINRDFDVLLWLDAVCLAIKPLSRIIEYTLRNGVYLWTSYTPTGEWTADVTLLNMGIDREKSFKIPELTTCVVSISTGSSKAQEFIHRWRFYSLDQTSFRGLTKPDVPWTEVIWNNNHCISTHPRVQGHRYDQTVASILAHQQGLSRTYLYTFDIQQILHGTSTISRTSAVPVDAEVIQNRDMKDGRGLSFSEHLYIGQQNRIIKILVFLRRKLKVLLFSLGIWKVR